MKTIEPVNHGQKPKTIIPVESEIEKEAFLGEIGALATRFAAKPLLTRAGAGALTGGALGALTSKPSVDANGNTKSNMLGGALSGAVTGGLTGAFMGKGLGVGKGAKAATSAAKAAETSAAAATATKAKSVTINPLKAPAANPSMSDIAHLDTSKLGTKTLSNGPKLQSGAGTVPKTIKPVGPTPQPWDNNVYNF